jgi:hypothetical protein
MPTAFLLAMLLQAPQSETWHFDSLQRIHTHSISILGTPVLTKTPLGTATSFNGVNDAIYIHNHPLANTATFTWEVIFQPAPDGNPEQRFFHLSSLNPQTGKDHDTRMLLETRLIGNQWCLDSYVHSPAGSAALLDRNKLHPTGQWHHVAMVYDGKTLRHYVNHVLQGETPLAFVPQPQGHASAGTRINQKDFFKGLLLKARFTKAALSPKDFWPVPRPSR